MRIDARSVAEQRHHGRTAIAGKAAVADGVTLTLMTDEKRQVTIRPVEIPTSGKRQALFEKAPSPQAPIRDCVWLRHSFDWELIQHSTTVVFLSWTSCSSEGAL